MQGTIMLTKVASVYKCERIIALVAVIFALVLLSYIVILDDFGRLFKELTAKGN